VSKWNLRGRVPLEPLDDERLTRIERAVVSQAQVGALAPTRRPWLAIGALALGCAGLVAGASWWLARRDGGGAVPSLVASDGASRVMISDEPVIVRAGAGGAHVDLGDARIDAGAGAELTATRPGGGVLVSLRVGTIELDVDKRGDRPPLVVRAGAVDVVVVGTRFAVTHAPGATPPVTVSVTEGLVRVEHDGVTTPVAAGQGWSAGAATTLAATTATTGPAATASAADGEARRPRPADKDSSAGATGPTSATASAPTAAETSADLAAAIRRQPVAAGDVPAGDPMAALAALRPRVTAHGAEASAALYAIARVQALSLGKDAEALRSLDAYARRFPRGAEIADALWLRVRLECRRLSSEACRVAAYSFLRAAPSGTTKAELATRATKLAH
jgi:TolA-binding protein